MERETFAEFKARHEALERDQQWLRRNTGEQWLLLLKALHTFFQSAELFKGHSFGLEREGVLTLRPFAAVTLEEGNWSSGKWVAEATFTAVGKDGTRSKPWHIEPAVENEHFSWRVRENKLSLSAEELVDELAKELAKYAFDLK